MRYNILKHATSGQEILTRLRRGRGEVVGK